MEWNGTLPNTCKSKSILFCHHQLLIYPEFPSINNGFAKYFFCPTCWLVGPLQVYGGHYIKLQCYQNDLSAAVLIVQSLSFPCSVSLSRHALLLREARNSRKPAAQRKAQRVFQKAPLSAPLPCRPQSSASLPPYL
jgi:hypothetical protein